MTMYGFHKLTSTLKSMEGINSDERYFEGLLTVQMKDKQGEVTIVDELYKVLPIWIDRGAPISDTHSNRIVGKGINYARTTVKSDDGSILPAIKITGKIFKNYELDNVIWDKIKNNEYKGLSFGGATRSARSPIKMKDGSTAYALSDLEHYEVAVCKDPAVPMAIITDFNHIAKANFDSTVRDDGKMVIQCSKMGCYVNSNKADLLTVMENEQPENHKKVEEGQSRGQAIDIPVKPKILTKKVLDNGKLRADDDFADPDKSLLLNTDKPDAYPVINRDFVDDQEDKDSKNASLTKKFMEKKELLEATIANSKEKQPQQQHSGEREEVTSGYKTAAELTDDMENINKILGALGGLAAGAIRGMGGAAAGAARGAASAGSKVLSGGGALSTAARGAGMIGGGGNEEEDVDKAGYKVDTEDRNNGTGINDIIREKRQFNGTKGTLSEELPNQIQQANLNESQTFEQKVQALIAEGKSRESAEKIVGSFVHKVEASSGSGGAGIGDGNNVNGGTMTTQTGGANNPVHNNGCDCTCKDCKRNDKCDCCEKCKNKSRGLDISNTGSGGVTESAFNQNAPNAQRLNNKAGEELTEEGKKIHDGVKEHVKQQQSYDMYKSNAAARINKIHGVMKLNKVRGAMPKGIASTGYDDDDFKDQQTSQGQSSYQKFHDHYDTKTPKQYANSDIKGDSEKLLNIKLRKSLDELKKLQIGGGIGSRGLGAGATYTQGQKESTQITLVQPRPTDDRVEAIRICKEPKE